MLFLREAIDADMALVLSWRNNPLVWEGTYTQKKPISLEEHEKWWQSRLDHISFMVHSYGIEECKDVGVVHISPLQYWSPEIGLIIGEVSLWNQGIGTQAFKLACDWLRDKGYKWTSTTVPDTNLSMIKVLYKLNFKKTCQARKGESRYALELV